MDEIIKLTIILATSLLLASQTTGFAGGSGTQAEPYEISTCQHLQDIQNDLSAYYILVSDIDCSSTESWNSGTGFKAIGSFGNKFTGSLDGEGHEVNQLTIDRSTDRIGLFGFLGSGTIKNIGLVNVSIRGTKDVGSLVGQSDAGSISQTYVTGSVSGNREVGGLIGGNGDASISDSYSHASVTGSDQNVGGFAGTTRGTISSLYSTGKVSGSASYTGGFTGGQNSDRMSNSYWDTISSNISSSYGSSTGLTTSQMQGSNSESNMDGLDFQNTWTSVKSEDSDTIDDGYPILQALSREEQLKAQEIYSTNSKPVTYSPSPKNTNKNPDSGIELSIKVEDPENDQMNITFYNNSDNSQIGNVENVQNGTYSTTWNGLSNDQEYQWHAEITDGTNTITTKPHNFTTIDIQLNWNDQSNNEKGFKIFNNATGTMQQVETMEENAKSYTDHSKNLEFGKTTQYQVKSYNSAGESKPLTGVITP